MKKTVLILCGIMLSIFLIPEVLSSNFYENAKYITNNSSGKSDRYLIRNESISEFFMPSCSRSNSSYYSLFKFDIPEGGSVKINLSLEHKHRFGVSLYLMQDGELSEVGCREFYSNRGDVLLLDKKEFVGETALLSFWHKEPIIDSYVEFDLSSDIEIEARSRSSLGVEVGTYTPQELVEDILLSGCVQASNIVYTGSDMAIGFFNNGEDIIGLSDGIIMSTGMAIDAIGPNSGINAASTNLGTPGDADLAATIGVTVGQTYDAAILEFDFIPASDELEFRYVFASEEYPEYTNSNFNDVFAFFISGGPENYNTQNIALIPGTSIPVSINNVNHLNNSEFYVINHNAAYSHCSPNCPYDIEFDGFTVPLTAYAAVTACETYQMKLAIADIFDGIWDSAVFLEAGSFFSGAAVDADNISDVGEDFDIWEGCSNTYLISLVEGADNSEDIIIDVSIDHENSTAVEGVDFSFFPEQLVIPAGETQVSFDYEAFNIEDGDIFFIVIFETGCPCPGSPGGEPIIDTIWIYDFAFVKGGIQDLQTKYCGEEAPEYLVLEGRTNLDPEIFYHWSTGEEGVTTTIYPEFGVSTYYLTMSDVCGNELYDEVSIIISDLSIEEITENFPSCTDACDGVFEIEVEGEFTPITYRYANEMWVSWPDSVHITSNNTFFNLCPANYRLTVTDAIGCDHRITFTIPNPPPIVLAQGLNESDMIFCDDPGEVTLTATSNQPTAIFEWSTGDTESETSFQPNIGSEEYWVKVFDGCGNYIQNYINIIYSDLQVNVDTGYDTGDCDGHASVLGTDGIHPYLYYWEAPLLSYNWEQTGLCSGYYTLIVTDAVGCQKEIEIFIGEDANIISESLYSDLFSVYPNPAQGKFTIRHEKAVSENLFVSITDVHGREVKGIQILSTETEVRDFSPGVYIVKFFDNDKIIGVEKLVITN